MLIIVIAAGTFVARAGGWRVSLAAAAAVAVVANGFSNSGSHGGQKRLKNWSDGSKDWTLKMWRKLAMFEGARQWPSFNHNSIDSGRIEMAPGLRMRRAGDANSETKAAFGGRPNASGLQSVCSVGARSWSRRACWGIVKDEGSISNTYFSGGRKNIAEIIE